MYVKTTVPYTDRVMSCCIYCVEPESARYYLVPEIKLANPEFTRDIKIGRIAGIDRGIVAAIISGIGVSHSWE